jgi:hypothetical protein
MLWKWKQARDCDEVVHLLNGETRHDQPVPAARVCMAWRGDHPRFWVFATKASKGRDADNVPVHWGWRCVAEPDDVLRLLRGGDPGVGPVAQAQVAVTWTGRERRFYVVYRVAVAGQTSIGAGDWSWTLAGSTDEVLRLLNGGEEGARPLTTARIAATHRDHHDEFFVFHRRDPDAKAVGRWHWQTVASADDVRAAVDRKGTPPVEFQVVAPPAGTGTFQLFTGPGTPAGVRVVDLGEASLLAR